MAKTYLKAEFTRVFASYSFVCGTINPYFRRYSYLEL